MLVEQMMYGYHCWGMGFGWLIGLIIIILVVWLLIRSRYCYYYHGWGGNSAIDILKERYAKGEISKQEFEEKKRDLLK